MLSNIRSTVLNLLVIAVLLLTAPAALAIVYVSQDGDGSSGDSWASAFTSIADALEVLSAGDAIYVGEGRYVIDSPMALPDNVAIVGGFSGFDKRGSKGNNPAKYPTILDGDDTAGSIFLCVGTVNILIDGFTFTGCVGAGGGGGRGGAIRCRAGAEVTVRQCTFRKNNISGFGGGINVLKSEATIEACTFTKNSADEGGALRIDSGFAQVDRCQFIENTAALLGGAISMYDAAISATECIVLGNDAPGGGGVDSTGGQAAEFVNCLVARNTADTQGAGMRFASHVGISVLNCTIALNTTEGNGGGIFLDNSTGEIINNIFAENNAHAIFENDENSDPVVANCLFDSNPGGAYFDEGQKTRENADGPGSLNKKVPEAFDNLDGKAKFADTSLDDFHLTKNSAAIDAAAPSSAPDQDIDRDNRPIGISKAPAAYDIGFDEYNPYAKLELIEPYDGDKWKRGKAYKIEWETEGYTGSTMRLELLRNGNVKYEIVDKTPNDGKFKWTVPDDVPGKKGFSVRITNVDDSNFTDVSNGEFRIK